MATNKNIQMQHYNGTDWDRLFPITLDTNVNDVNGISSNSKFSQLFSKGIVSTSYSRQTGETDDTPKFNRIVADSVSQGYLPIFIVEDLTISDTITTPQAFKQPLIIGKGYKQTTINYSNIANGLPAIKFKGGSGALVGGGVMFLGFEGNSTSIGVEFADCCGVNAYQCHFGTNRYGVRFHNESSGGFTEYCKIEECDFDSTCSTAYGYVVTSGNDSFHGSGAINSTINQSASEANAKVEINTGCLVYNAPLSIQTWVRCATPVITNNGSIKSNFHGNITIETSGSGFTGILANGSSGTFISGSMQSFGENMETGTASFVERFQANSDGSTNMIRKQQSKSYSLNNGTTNLFYTDSVENAIATVFIKAPNYEYIYTLLACKNPTSNGGTVTILSTPRSFNQAGYGGGTFSVSSSNYLTYTNSNIPSNTATAYVTWVNLGQRIQNFMV